MWDRVFGIILPPLYNNKLSPRAYLLKRFMDGKEYFEKMDKVYPFNGFVNSLTKLDFLFLSHDFRDIILYLKNSSYKVGILGNEKDLEFAIQNNLKFIPYFYILKALRIFIEKPYKKQKLLIENLKKKIAYIFNRLQIKYIVLYNHVSPLDRFLISLKPYLKGTKILIIQHGIFFRENILNAKFEIALVLQNGDYYLTYGEYFTKLFNISAKKFKIQQNLSFIPFGYPKKLNCKNIKNTNKKKRKIIGFLGQPYEIFSAYLGHKKNEIWKKVYNILKNDYVVYYKPHPQEVKFSLYPKKYSKIFLGSLEEFFNLIDIAIGIDSTALMEASICGIPAIQIYSKDFSSDYFEDIGIAYTVSEKELHKLPFLLKEALKPFKINPQTVKILEEPGRNFLNVINFQ